ncbi:dienelactone hydrolase family protein [Pedomonas mirosovicensis]|uniref:dienelactone hydrolase family protein n=1 Tax=Pedomonas mirosovicensis TaxID=2908641 RepID=UPI0021680471|nr:dienelactone hydrolase family protein [Pedomonas mirosovicensis]MCH8684108.1 dienelactone hydrolase family protein [Pedomonas mirosovicensis]
MGREISLTASDGSGSFSAYLAEPASGTGPGIVVIQEIFGVNHDVRAKCDAWAEKGYFALAPDLFWRQEPGVQITDKTEAEWAKAMSLMNGLDLDKGIEDLKTAIDSLREVHGCTGKVGTVGFCLGGRLAYMCATRTNADANAAYYGVTIEKMLDEAANITRPLLMHIAQEDRFVSKDAQAQIHAALDDHPQVTIYDYPGVDHAFTRINGQNFDRQATDLAHGRTTEFFAEHLR